MLPRLNLIGSGRVGQTLAGLWIQTQQIQLQSIHNAHLTSALQATKNLGQGRAVEHIQDLPEADIYLVTTPDDMIESISLALANAHICRPGSLIMHCSGALTAQVFAPLQAQGLVAATAHPARSFPVCLTKTADFKGTYCALEGDALAVERIRPLFTALGAQCLNIAAEHKVFYHIAGVLTTNYLVSLAYHAQSILKNIQISDHDSMQLVHAYMEGAVGQMKQSASIQQALTGPVQRGDLKTLTKHCQALESHELNQVYRSLAQATLPLTLLEEHKKQACALLLSESEKDRANSEVIS